jgi:putative ABC transport system permease protein
MKITHIIEASVAGLKAHKSRSILTILGIVIGITAIILIMSLGEGAQDLILGQIQSIGSKTIAIDPGRMPTGPSDFASIFADSLKERDLEALSNKANVPHASVIMPIVFGSETVSFGSETYTPSIFGVTEYISKVYDIYPKEGRMFNDDEVRGYADVAVIGSKVAEELFDGQYPVGQKIKIKGRNFRVIGLFPKKGQFSFINFDNAIAVPYTTAQRYVFGIKHFNEIVVETDSEENVAATVRDIELTLRNNHNITDPEKDDFYIQTQADAMEMVGTITSILTLFLVSVAAISLLVGGIGIMNIMLVSVTERTKEIGLRKALGATGKNILTQFLLEAVILTVLGGIIGIILGAAFSFITALVLSQFIGLDWNFTFPISGAVIGFSVAAGIGLIFGLYPARQASKKSPIEALRYE